MYVQECDEDPDLEGKLFKCQISDFSGQGLHVLSSTAVIPDTSLSIFIKTSDPVANYRLLGEVRWTKIKSNQCYIGIQFTEDENTDLNAWVTDFGSM